MSFPRLPAVHRSGSPRRAPVPVGPLSGKRTWWRRLASLGTATVNRALDRVPPGRWLHRRVLRGLSVTDVDVPVRRAAADLHGLRLALVTDVHAGSFMGERDLCLLFERIAAAEPDLVCLGGDLINTFDREILLYRRPLRLLDPPLGVFAVPGNHDHFFGKDIGLWTSFLAEHGVRVLINAGARVQRGEASLWVAGVDDLTEGQPDLAAALQGHREAEPVVLLSHHPDFFFEAAAAGVELTLSGHTHGGQVVVLGLAPLRHSVFGYMAGLYEEDGARLYVSRGVGVTFLPLRLGAPPEIPMLRLQSPACLESAAVVYHSEGELRSV
jgi:predicted MPP superfamily phosphohydrolase